MATREELLRTVSQRYRGSSRADKSRILEEFSMTTGYHRNMRCGYCALARPTNVQRFGRRAGFTTLPFAKR